MLLKLLIIILILYWAGKTINRMFGPVDNRDEIKGKPRGKKPLDLSNFDVEDADYEEIDE